MKRIGMIVCVVVSLNAYAQQISYSAMDIPEDIKKHASVVKRYEKIEFEVKDIGRASEKVHRVVSVMSENGKNALTLSLPSGKFHLIEDVEARLFDAYGKQIARYKRKDFHTVAISQNLIDDSKYTYIEIPAQSYPVTVEYKFEYLYKGTLSYPSYTFILPGMAVEQSTYTATVPKDLDLRHFAKNTKITPVVADNGNAKTYTWSVKNLPASEYEEGAVSFESRYPSIQLAPNRFKLDDYEGDLSSWKNFGHFYNALQKNATVLPAEKAKFFQDLTKDAKDNREKAKLLYKYLQQNFRYVSIQLGIGGLKAFPATFTDEKKYGDCKGLSTYMQAALASVGIKSHQALINAGYNEEPVDPAFPSDPFDHVILCVPTAKDTIWLECTSKTNDFAVLGNFTENRNALLITENGGVLVATPKSKYNDNVFSAYTTIDVVEDGSGKSTSVITSNGEYKEQVMHYLFEQNEDDKKDFIVNYLGYKQPDAFAVSRKEELNGFKAAIEMQIEKVPQFVAGSKMFFSPRIYKLLSAKLPKSEGRKLDFYFRHPFEKSDTTQINLPAGFKPDALPKEKNLDCGLASYSTRYWYDESKNALFSSATLILKEYKIPADKYAGVKKFFDDVMLDDNERIVVKKS